MSLESLLAGRVLADRYRIEEVIGRGGMGAVYRATDERLGRKVAVKVITLAGAVEDDARERLRARFYREARAAAALPHHPNVVPVYDYGSDPALGLDYIVMELLHGSDLATRLARSGPPPLPAALRILYEAARGVAVGHRAGLIHRDVKPGNIFLAQSDSNEIQVRMVDFGIAKLADEEDTFNQLTQDGRVPHSPAYASPEQLRGLSDLTPASDVFSLGAVGFTLLSGQRPFSEADRNRMSLGMPVEPPRVRTLNPAVPASVEEILLKALAPAPEQRFASAVEMADELGGVLRGLPETPLDAYPGRGAAAILPPEDEDVTRVGAPEDDRTIAAPPASDDRTIAAPPPPPGRSAADAQPPARAFPPRRQERSKRGVGGILVWLLVIAVLGAAAFWIWDEMDGGAPPPQTAEQIPPPPETIPRVSPETTVEDTVDPQPDLQAFVVNNEGLTFFHAGDYEAAADRFRLATQLAPDVADYAYNLGFALHRMGDAEAAVPELRRATRLDRNRPDAHYRLGLAELAVGDTSAAWTSLQRARELARTPGELAAATRELRAIERAQAPAERDTARPAQPDSPRVRVPDAPPLDTMPSVPIIVPSVPVDTIDG